MRSKPRHLDAGWILILPMLSLLLLACSLAAPLPEPAAEGAARADGDGGGQIALTFDDAPGYDGPRFTGTERTDRILRALEQEGVREAVFFCNSKKLDADGGRQRVERYARAGHLIANHTHSHLNLDKTRPEDFIEDIRKADVILRTFPRFVPLFRYPHSREGATDEARRAVRDALDRMGYELGYFTVDAADWYVEQLYEAALQQRREVDYEKLKSTYLDATWRSLGFYDGLARAVLGRSPKHVLILHETDINAMFVGDLIRFLKSRGWKIIPASEAYAEPLLKGIPRGGTTQYRLVGLALERGFAGAVGNPWAETATLDRMFASAFR